MVCAQLYCQNWKSDVGWVKHGTPQSGALREPVQNRVTCSQRFDSVRNPPFPRFASRTLRLAVAVSSWQGYQGWRRGLCPIMLPELRINLQGKVTQTRDRKNGQLQNTLRRRSLRAGFRSWRQVQQPAGDELGRRGTPGCKHGRRKRRKAARRRTGLFYPTGPDGMYTPGLFQDRYLADGTRAAAIVSHDPGAYGTTTFWLDNTNATPGENVINATFFKWEMTPTPGHEADTTIGLTIDLCHYPAIRSPCCQFPKVNVDWASPRTMPTTWKVEGSAGQPLLFPARAPTANRQSTPGKLRGNDFGDIRPGQCPLRSHHGPRRRRRRQTRDDQRGRTDRVLRQRRRPADHQQADFRCRQGPLRNGQCRPARPLGRQLG